jgi:hypothetical protein
MQQMACVKHRLPAWSDACGCLMPSPTCHVQIPQKQLRQHVKKLNRFSWFDGTWWPREASEGLGLLRVDWTAKVSTFVAVLQSPVDTKCHTYKNEVVVTLLLRAFSVFQGRSVASSDQLFTGQVDQVKYKHVGLVVSCVMRRLPALI